MEIMEPMALTDDLNGDQQDQKGDQKRDCDEVHEVLSLFVPIINV